MSAKNASNTGEPECPLCRFESASPKKLCIEHGSAAMLVFRLPENEDEHRNAVNGGRYHSVLWDIDQQCRNWLKYGHSFESADQAIEAIRELIRDEDVLE